MGRKSYLLLLGMLAASSHALDLASKSKVGSELGSEVDLSSAVNAFSDNSNVAH